MRWPEARLGWWEESWRRGVAGSDHGHRGELGCGRSCGLGRSTGRREAGKKEKKRDKRKEQGPKNKRKGLVCEVEGPIREMTKTEEGGCKVPGGGKTKLPGGTRANPRV